MAETTNPMEQTPAKKTRDAYAFLRDNGHLKFIQKARKCQQYMEGAQWDTAALAKLDKERRPALTINMVMATMLTVFGEMLDNRADTTFYPVENGDDQVAKALSMVYRYIGRQNGTRWLEQEVGRDGIITGRGFFDIRMEFDTNMMGEVKITRLAPEDVMIDAQTEAYDPAKWNQVIISRWMTMDEIEAAYGKAKRDELEQSVSGNATDPGWGYDYVEKLRTVGDKYTGFTLPASVSSVPDQVSQRRVRVFDRQYRQLRQQFFVVDVLTGDTRAAPDGMDEKQLQQMVEQVAAAGRQITYVRKTVRAVRWTVAAADVTLHDDWSPYDEFTVVPYFPIFVRGYTGGIVEHILSLQEMLNKVSSQELHVINTTANSGWKVKTGALTNMTIQELERRGAETGLVVEVENVADIEKIHANTVPTGLANLSARAGEWIKYISGASDAQRGVDNSNDRAAAAIRTKQLAGSMTMSSLMDNMARTREILARRALSLIQRYYTEPRVLRITPRRPGEQAEEAAINQPVDPDGQFRVNDVTVGKYDVSIISSPMKRNWRESQFEQAVMMRQQLGVAIPDAYLIKASALDDKDEIVQSLAQESSQVAQMKQQMEQMLAQAKAASDNAAAQLREAQARLMEARAAKIQQETGIELEDHLTLPKGPEVAMAQIDAAREAKQMDVEAKLAQANITRMAGRDRQLADILARTNKQPTTGNT